LVLQLAAFYPDITTNRNGGVSEEVAPTKVLAAHRAAQFKVVAKADANDAGTVTKIGYP